RAPRQSSPSSWTVGNLRTVTVAIVNPFSGSALAFPFILLSPCRPQLLPGGSHDMFGREAELLLQFLQRRRRPERLHAQCLPACPDIPLPAEGGRQLHGHAGRHRRRQNALTVGRVI